MNQAKPTYYWDYIRVEELLALQSGLEADDRGLDNDEVLFITVHQVYELWFKLVLRELAAARDLFKAPRVAEQELSNAVRSLRRAVTIFRTATTHFEVVETLTTREYLAFRDKLMPASGFQSAQMRQIEILFGLDADERIPLGFEGSYLKALEGPGGAHTAAQERVERQFADLPSLRVAVEDWLHRTPIDGCPHDAPEAGERLQGFLAKYLAAHSRETDSIRDRAVALAASKEDAERLEQRYEREKEAVRAFLSPGEGEDGLRRSRIRAAQLFIVTYRELPLLAWPREVLEALIELEQVFVIFRQRHARMVERVIGRRTGTGGSAGVEYLDQTALAYRVFRDLWAIRTIQIRRAAAPKLEDPEFYGFRAERGAR